MPIAVTTWDETMLLISYRVNRDNYIITILRLLTSTRPNAINTSLGIIPRHTKSHWCANSGGQQQTSSQQHASMCDPGLANLNQCDLNRDLNQLIFFVKKIERFKLHWWFHLPMKNYNKVNKQNEVYCFIVLFCPLLNLLNLSTTDFSL